MYRIFRKSEGDKFSGGDIFEEFRSSSTEQKAEETEEKETEIEEIDDNGNVSELEAAFKESMRMAEEIVEKANVKAEEIKKDAYDNAWKSGYEVGKAEGQKQGETYAYRDAMDNYNEEFSEKLKNLEKTIEEYVKDMEIEKEKILEKYIDNLRDISLAIGEKIVRTSLKSSEDVVKRMILAATEKLKKTAWAKIYIAGIKDGSEIKGDVEFLHSLSKLSDNIKIVVLDDEEPGTCLIELPDEIIDISFKSQLENIREILYNARS